MASRFLATRTDASASRIAHATCDSPAFPQLRGPGNVRPRPRQSPSKIWPRSSTTFLFLGSIHSVSLQLWRVAPRLQFHRTQTSGNDVRPGGAAPIRPRRPPDSLVVSSLWQEIKGRGPPTVLDQSSGCHPTRRKPDELCINSNVIPNLKGQTGNASKNPGPRARSGRLWTVK